MLEKLFESLDEKVFTDELKEALEAKFNDAVETKASVIAEAKIETEIETLNEKAEAHIEFLTKKAEEFVEIKKTELVESLDKYLDRITDEFVAEAKETLDESVKSEKADMIIEAFDTMLTATGVEVSKIIEAKDETAAEAQLAETVEKYDALIEENITLQDENDNLIKMGVIAEMTDDLSIVEAEKFKKLADLVEFTKDVTFAEKLETIKESVKGAAENNQELKESTAETENSNDRPAWAHLV